MTLREFHVFPWGIIATVMLLVWGAGAAAASDGGTGLRLIMVRALDCRFCQRWEAEVGRVYDKSAEGQQAPLHRVERGAPELEGLKPAVYTPTFILAQGNREISRITGYPGESYFWEELGEMLRLAQASDGGRSLGPAGNPSGATP